MRRRRMLLTAVGLGAMAGSYASAQDYPARPIRLLVGFAAGGTADITARQLSEPLGAALGQAIVVENKPGAGGNIASAGLARATPDGYVLMLATPGQLVVNPLTQKTLGFDPKTPFSLIGLVNTSPFVVVVPADSPFKTIQELLAYGKKNPGKLSYASPGMGTTMHMGGEMLNASTGMNALHVPYKGGSQSTTELIAGRVHFMVDNLGGVSKAVEAGQLRVLAVTTSARIPRFAELPAMNELLPEYELSSWVGVIGPPDLPANVASVLSGALAKAIQDPRYVESITQRGSALVDSSPAYFARHLERERQRVGRTIAKTGLKFD